MFNKATFLFLIIAVLMLLAPTANAGPIAGAACFSALAAACLGLGPGWFACYSAGIVPCEIALAAPTP